MTSDCTYTVYKDKKTKIVYLLSFMHKSICIDKEHCKQLPATVNKGDEATVTVDKGDGVCVIG